MNYPNGIKKSENKPVNYANRGMSLEAELNDSNNFYLIHNIAIIHKKPTPIVVKKVDYNSSRHTKIKDAYFEKPSTTDYNGIYRGKYIDFEAKETKNQKYFPLRNIHKHQIKHIKKVIEHGGIGFLIIRFSFFDETYLLDGNDFITFLNTNKRKSIPYSFFQENAYLIEEKYNPRLDYLKIINKIYFKGGNYE